MHNIRKFRHRNGLIFSNILHPSVFSSPHSLVKYDRIEAENDRELTEIKDLDQKIQELKDYLDKPKPNLNV